MMDVKRSMDLEPEQNREVFARFGLAMYQAQCLERQLAIILATKHSPDPSRVAPEELEETFELQFSKTFGKLVEEIGKLVQLSDDECGRLNEALVKRNWLAHRYFWERAYDILTERGRAKMIQELQEVSDFLSSLDAVFTCRTFNIIERFGISEQTVNKEIERTIGDREEPDRQNLI